MSVSRFVTINGQPPMHPGCCSICQSTGGRFVDFGLQLRRVGRIYFCESCLAECVGELGYLSPDKALELKATTALLAEENEELQNDNSKLRAVLSAAFDVSGLNLSGSEEPAESDTKPAKRPVGRPKKPST